MKEAYIDRIFRGYGERDFGKTLMDTVSSKQLESFRCEAFKALDDMMKHFGKQENHHPKHNYCMDLREFNKLPDEQIPEELFNLDILDGSPPCTTFSCADQNAFRAKTLTNLSRRDGRSDLCRELN